MPSYGTSLGLTLPTVGQAAWGGSLNTILQTIIDVLEAKVTPSGLNLNATVDVGDNALTAVLYTRFVANASNVTAVRSFWAKSDGEAYFTDGAGNVVQLTQGGSIKASPGSIGGQYASDGASVVYLSAASAYYFYDHTGTSAFADVNTGDLKLHDGTTTNFVGHAAPSSVPTSYTVTWPSGSGGYDQMMSMAGDGTIKLLSSSFLTFPQKTRLLPYTALVMSGTSANSFTQYGYFQSTATNQVVYLPLSFLREGDRIDAVSIHANDRAVTAAGVSAELWRISGSVGSAGGPTPVAGYDAATGSDNWTVYSLTGTLPETALPSTRFYTLKLQCAAAGMRISGVRVAYTRITGSA